MRHVPIIVVALLTSALGAVVLADEPRVNVRRVPDGGLYPQAQVDSRGRICLIYFKGDPRQGDIYFVRCDEAGKVLAPALRVNSQRGSALIIGTVRGPHLAVGKDDHIHVAWMGSNKAEPKAGGKDAPMLYTRLNDAGNAFEPQRNVIQRYPGLDGGGSVAADRDGNVYVAWHAPARHGGDEQDRRIWVTRSRDEGRTFEREKAAIDRPTGACGCCGMSLGAGAKGRVMIAYRSAGEMIHRDIHLLFSKDAGMSFEVAAVDPWRVGKCVMSTSGFAWSTDQQIAAAAWETQERIRLALINAEGRLTNSPTTVASRGRNPKHPRVAMNRNGECLVVWTEGTAWNQGGSIAWQGYDARGEALAETHGTAQGLAPWSVPAVIPAADGSFSIFF